MKNRESPLYWSFPIGTWFLTSVRVSVFFPLILLVLCVRLESTPLGLTVGGLLFVAVLFHEYGHIVAARLTGGMGDEILIWPLGGLANVRTAPTFKSRFFTSAAGPLVNLAICLITLFPVMQSDHMRDAFNPLVIPNVQLAGQLSLDLLVLTFAVNWILFLINLIPVYPLDGGRMLQTCLTKFWDREIGTGVYIKIGFVVAILGLLAGLMLDNLMLVTISAFVLVLNMQESMQLRTAEGYDENFMGYDFSQGYTSLERAEDERPPKRPGPVARWKEKRRAEKQRLTEEKAAAADLQLDELLDKVHAQGIDSLSEAERRQLHRASARYRDKGGKPQ